MNTCNHPIIFGKLSVILCQKDKQENLLKDLKGHAFLTPQKDFILIQKNWPLFPYLKVKDQVLLNLSENKKERLAYQEKLKIDSLLLNKESDQLSLFEKIKLQLLHALLAKKEKIIIEDLLDRLSVSDTQELLDLLNYVAKSKKIAILLLTHDETIAHSPYITHLHDER
ncbi:MAG: hypothetical protein IC227_07820 [Enterococcus lacertideformus]|uniref:KAP NTPase domain-containing protein n=1 Tax=Enterococcus lacertideformus TaxID=2771493 RepID=A0A931B2V5_9ENTE|nr:hypothetical protein [Enterococcus lacertideformus]